MKCQVLIYNKKLKKNQSSNLMLRIQLRTGTAGMNRSTEKRDLEGWKVLKGGGGQRSAPLGEYYKGYKEEE